MDTNDDNTKAPGAEQYWYNTKTRQVETGHQSSWTHLMGPYGSKSEAEAALKTAQARNEEWDSEEER